MAIRSIVEAPDPLLRQVSKPVAELTDSHRKLIADMFETMYAAPGIGLAAIQVGVPERILVIDLQEVKEEGAEPVREPRVFVNPEILEASQELQVYNEGCLSLPEQYAEVQRPARVRARWQDEKGKTYEQELNGLLAVCLQHEMDHLEGILFVDHLSRLKRDMIMKKLVKAKSQTKKAA